MKTLFTFLACFITTVITASSQDLKLEWAKQIGLNHYANAESIAIDKSGNVYTAGRFAGTVDFDPNEGKYELDEKKGWGDMYISKLNSKGEFVWAKSFGDTMFQDACAIAVDDSNNVYAVGYFEGTVDLDPGIGVSTVSTDFYRSELFLVKLDSSGNYIWGKILPHFVYYRAMAYNIYRGSIKFDSYGNVYLNTNKGIIKYDSNGNLIWNKEVEVVLTYFDDEQCTGTAIDIDKSNTIYTVGNYTGKIIFDGDTGSISITGKPRIRPYFDSGTDIFISKSNLSGKYLWAKGATRTPNLFDTNGRLNTASALAIDRWGNIYVVGKYGGTVYMDSKVILDATRLNYSIFMLKFNPEGVLLWSKSIESGNYSTVNSIAVDNLGDIYITGDFNKTTDFDPGPEKYYLTMEDSMYYRHSFAAKFDSSGKFKWAKQFSMVSSDYSFSSSIAVDANRNVYISGTFTGNADFDPGAAEYILANPTNAYNAYIVKLSQTALDVQDEVAVSSPFSVYPNPFSETLTVNFGKQITNGRIKLINLLGQALYEKSDVNSTSLSLDITNQPKGMYFIEVNEGGNVELMKIIKE